MATATDKTTDARALELLQAVSAILAEINRELATEIRALKKAPRRMTASERAAHVKQIQRDIRAAAGIDP